MKINQLTRFPYPVLEPYTDDYVNGLFSVGIDISESLKSGGLQIRYEIQLTEQKLNEWVASGVAKAVIFVTCLETYYNQMHEIRMPRGSLEIGKGELAGDVVLLPLLVLARDVRGYSNENFNPDYSGMDFDLPESAILAIGDDYVVNAGREKLAPIESIFNLAIDNSVPVNQCSVFLEDEKITILAEEKTYHSVYNIRNTTAGKSIILNSVYLPVVMEVLSAIQLDPGPYQDRHWYKVFSAKCTYENINMENPELLRDAQKLLKSPLTKVISVMHELD